jgi:hypothetical protein
MGYLALAGLGYGVHWQPRLFWTVLVPILPIAVVLMGFSTWRRICPLAFFGDVGRRLNRGKQRRVPEWFERWFFLVVFCILLAMLVLRLVATNGDGRWIGGLLVGLALAAIVTNWIFTGKTWCNFACPVGLVERIYTEPNSLVNSSGNSQCERCTACKKYCPDIDQENGYWRDLTSSGRRIATFAFPGLVLGFYAYYWLRHGDWEAYFGGQWTARAADVNLALGPGFFFAPAVPALLASTLTLFLFSVASFGFVGLVEAGIGRFGIDSERRRHLSLAIAAFMAFCIFYGFAGAPTLRLILGAPRALAFIAPLVATLFLVKRWNRRREQYIREKGASKLLRNWPFDEPPPDDPEEVYTFIKAGEHAREQHLTAYSNTVCEMIHDGLVTGSELRFLDEIRKQLGISEREHEKIIARLSEDERHLFEQDGEVGAEQRAQLEGYQTALTEALLRHAPEREIGELREAFGVSEEAHAALLEKMRGQSGPLLARAREQMERALAIHRDIEALGFEESRARDFLSYLLLKAKDAAVNLVLEFLEIAGDTQRVQALRTRLFGADQETRRSALEQLVEACKGHEEFVRELETVVIDRIPETQGESPEVVAELLQRCIAVSDPYIRASAVWTAANEVGTDAGPLVAESLKDSHPLVRETAVHAARHILKLAETRVDGGMGVTEVTKDSKEPLDTDDKSKASESALAALWRAIGTGAEVGFSSFATIEKMEFLRAVPLFTDLDPEDLHDLCLLAEEQTVEPSELLCKEGEVDAGDLFILVEGEATVSVKVQDESREGEHELGVLYPGEVIGELSLLDGSPRSATVRPRAAPLRVLRIPGNSFRARLLHRSRVTLPLLTTMAQRIRRLSLQAASAQDEAAKAET